MKIEMIDYAVRIYSDTSYTYQCFAAPGTAVSEAKWQIKRIDNATGSVDWANGDSNFDNIAENYAQLTYI